MDLRKRNRTKCDKIVLNFFLFYFAEKREQERKKHTYK